MNEPQANKSMPKRTMIIIGFAVLVVVFLLGFLPQYGQVRALRSQASASQKHSESVQSNLKMAQLRDLMGLSYLETNRKNYGVARQHSSEFFTKASQLIPETSDPVLIAMLEETVQRRDHITAGLAEGQPAILTDLEAILNQLYAVRRY